MGAANGGRAARAAAGGGRSATAARNNNSRNLQEQAAADGGNSGGINGDGEDELGAGRASYGDDLDTLDRRRTEELKLIGEFDS